MAMPEFILQDINVDATEQILVITPVDSAIRKSLYVINKGANPVTIRIYGSPTGITVANFTSIKTGVAQYTQAEVDLHYDLINAVTVLVPSLNRAYIDLSNYVYNYFKITAQTIAGLSVINYAMQKAAYSEAE